MKKENGIYLVAFIAGVIIVNLVGNATWANSSILNRYSLANLSFQGIVYEEYLLQILFLRFRTVIVLWMLSKLFTKRVISVGYAIVMCVMLGGIIAMAILANGVWGVLFFISALMPHILFYGVAFAIWSNTQVRYSMEGTKSVSYIFGILILVLTVVGCICEAYISPVFMENVIKF